MKQGRSLTDLATEIERQAATKRDYLATTDRLTMIGGSVLAIGESDAFEITEHTHNQVGSHLDIPAKFYDRLRQNDPEALDWNVNRMFRAKPIKRMVRTLDGRARAFLSDRYRRLDHYDLMDHVLPEIRESQLNIVSAEVTDTRLYLKFTTPKVQGEVKKGDIVEAGGVISNSEIGSGAISVLPFLNRLICLNGAVVNEFGQRKYHTGKRVESDDESLYADDTLKADDTAFWMKVRDLVRAVTQQPQFDKLLGLMRASAERKIEAPPESVIEVLAARYQLNEGERTGILRHLIDDGVGYTQYGLMNAITSVAGEVDSYDRASELESHGGSVLTLPASAWKSLASAEPIAA